MAVVDPFGSRRSAPGRALSVEWEKAVRKAEDACVACGARFGPGSGIVTSLDLLPDGFRREDRCEPCADARAEEPFASWRHRRPAGARPGPRKLDLAWLTELFKRLAGRPDDANARRILWIAALLLLRRRILEETGRRHENGVEVLDLRLKREERDYSVADPGLDKAAMVTIESDLAALFNLDEAAGRSAPGG